MDPNLFDNVQINDNVNQDIRYTTEVINALYNLEGGDKLIQKRQNEDRLVEIDRYYIAKYKAQTRVLKTFIFFCCLALIGSVLFNKGIISLLMYTSYVGILGIIMLYIVGRDIVNIFIRDSTNYDEYDYSLSYSPSFSDVSGSYNSAELSNIPSCPS